MNHLIPSLATAAALAACAGGPYGGGPYGPYDRPGTVIAPGTVQPMTPVYGRILNRVDRLPFARDHIVVFVGPNCPLCARAVQDVQTIATGRVEVLDVSTGYGAQQYAAMRLPGPLPAVVVSSQVMVGYDPQLLRSVLGGAGMRDTNPRYP
jgi:hypothetical protein